MLLQLVQEVDAAGKRAICVYVPVPLQKVFQKIQVRIIRELEKKFSGRPVVVIAQRRILPKEKRNVRSKQKQRRPRRLLIHLLMSHPLVCMCVC